MKKSLLIALSAVIAATGTYVYVTRLDAPVAKGAGAAGGGRPVPVAVGTVRSGDIDLAIDALGTVVAYNTALVKARVDGQLESVVFREGQLVKAGDLLATIDPRPFQVLLDQAAGQLRRDEALLANARIDLERYRDLLTKDSIARQQVDAQEALVRQYEGVVQTDRAQVDNARLQLGFTRVTAPVGGRLGLRQLDVGNMVRAGDTNGIVTITQTQPIHVVFAIPADQLPAVLARVQRGAQLAVDAYDRDGRTRLAQGRLQTIDNQIDPTTGTVKLKAVFANTDNGNALFPNQFVNARLRVDTRKAATLAPTAAIQRGTQGSFVYVVEQGQTVSVRPVVLGIQTGDVVAVDKGLAPGERVVVDGADKLRQGARIEIPAADGGGAGPNAPSRDKGGHGGKGE